MSKKGHGRGESAILSMPKLFRATELVYQSEVSKFATYKVEEKDNDQDSDEWLMKSIKNERCVALQLKWVLEKVERMDHPNLPRISYTTFSENYSYVVFENPDPKMKNLINLFEVIKHNESLCKDIIYELCRTLQYTHSFGIIHRDLRANNIYLDINESNMTLNRLLLIDLRATQALQPDNKLSILQDGSAYLTGYVRKKFGQYPAPEILMDISYDRQVDAWFVGVLIYRILNGGNVPFKGDNDEEVSDNILHSQTNKLSIGKTDMDQWLEISDELDDIVNGLLIKDAKKRYCIDDVLWSDWVKKYDISEVSKIVLQNWINEFNNDNQSEWEFDYRFVRKNEICSLMLRFCAFAVNINQCTHKGKITFYNSFKSVLHQFKVCNMNGVTSHNNEAYIKSDCFVTLSTNIWISSNTNPITFEYVINYAKYDIYFGIIAVDEFTKTPNYFFYIGSGLDTFGVSVRYGKAYFNDNDVQTIKRKEYLKQNIARQNGMNRAQRIHRIEETPEDTNKENNERNSTNMFSGPPPLRNVSVKMRIDSASRTISLRINDVTLDPLYYEFTGHVLPSVTLCHCMDQVSIKSVKMDWK